jgi:Flp pilus assembly protein TadG
MDRPLSARPRVITRGRAREERGSAVIEFAFYAGLSLLFLMSLANLVVWRITQGVMHSAVDQGARAGARFDVDGASTCEDRIAQALVNVLAGPAGDGATYSCSDDGEVVRAEVRVVLRAWLPPLTDRGKIVTGQARKEHLP